MTIYVGESVTILVAAVNPVTNVVIADATGRAEFYAPPKNPAKVPADRVVDHGPVTLTFNAAVANKDGSLGAYVGFVDTSGWLPGKWSFKATLTGSYDTWEFGTFNLVA